MILIGQLFDHGWECGHVELYYPHGEPILHRTEDAAYECDCYNDWGRGHPRDNMTNAPAEERWVCLLCGEWHETIDELGVCVLAHAREEVTDDGNTP